MWLTESQQARFLERVADLATEFDYVRVSFCTKGPRPSGRGTYELWHNSIVDAPRLVARDGLSAERFQRMVEHLAAQLEKRHPGRKATMARVRGTIECPGGDWIVDSLTFWSKVHGFSVPDWRYLDQFTKTTRGSTIRHLSNFPRY